MLRVATCRLNSKGEMSPTLRFISNTPAPRADVVFVHGIRPPWGKPELDWTASGTDPAELWPEWLSDDIAGLRVALLTYDADLSRWRGTAMHIEDRALNVLAALQVEGIGQRPLIFVTHSLGGLLVKALIRKSQSRTDAYGGVATACRGVVFLATPHSGSALADIVKALKVARTSPAIDTLKRDNEALLHLNADYREWAAHSEQVKHLVLKETRPMLGVKIVPGGSADPGIPGAVPIAIDANHEDIARPASRSNLVYKLVAQLIQGVVDGQEALARDAGGFVAARSPERVNAEAVTRLRRETFARPGVIDIAAWQTLITHAHFNWRAEIETRVTDLRAAGASETLTAPLVDPDIGLEALANRLRGTDLGEVRRALQDPPPAALAALDWLRSQGEEPSFRTAIPISGRWGAGKTLLALRLCEQLAATGSIILVPSQDARGSLAERVLEAFAAATAATPGDLREVERWLQTHERSAIVVVEDAHLRVDAYSAADLISDSALSGRITWIVTADSDRLDLLLGGSRSRAWRRHGFHNHSALGTGWLDLDEINAAEKVGLQILRGWSEQLAPDDIEDLEQHSELTNAGLLVEPWAAWLKATEHGESDIPLWQPSTEFVRALWTEYSDRLLQLGVPAALSERLRVVLTREFVARRAAQLEFSDVLSAFGSGAWPRSEVRASIWKFISAGVIAYNQAPVPGATPAADVEAIRAEPAALWSKWLFAVEMSERNRASDDVTQQWLASAQNGNWTAQLVATEWLNGVSLPRSEQGREESESFLQRWIGDSAADKSALWIALRLATRPEREVVARWVVSAAPRAASPRECLLFLRLMQHYQNSEWPRLERLNLLADRWFVIGHWDLGAVAVRVVSSMLDFRELSHLRATLDALEGFEKTGYGLEMAGTFTLGYAEDHPWASIFAQLVEYLRSLRPTTTKRSEVALSHMSQPLRSEDPPIGFWHQVLSRAVREFVYKEGTAAYDKLRQWAWFEDAGSPVVTLAMRKSAQIELGAIYRRRGKAGREAFVRFVERLVQGDLHARTSAIYVIKHTEVTGGQREVRVDRVFHAFLTQLGNDPELRTLRDLQSLLAANRISTQTSHRSPTGGQRGPNKRRRQR